jgi:hypothetical protein
MDHRPSRGQLPRRLQRPGQSLPLPRQQDSHAVAPSTGNPPDRQHVESTVGPARSALLRCESCSSEGSPVMAGSVPLTTILMTTTNQKGGSFLRRRGPPRPRRTTRLLRLVAGPLGLRGSAGARPGRCIRFCARVAFRIGERHGVQVRPRHRQSRQGVGQSLPKLREIAGQENLEITIEIRRNECKIPLRLSGDAAGLRVARPAESTIWRCSRPRPRPRLRRATNPIRPPPQAPPP